MELSDLAQTPGETSAPRHGALSGVIDIGKTRCKLLVLSDAGEVVYQRQMDSKSHWVPEGYLALDVDAIEAWLRQSLADLGPLRRRLRHLITTTHGATFAALDGDKRVLPVADYEFEGFDLDRSHDLAGVGDEGFPSTMSPLLARGLNLGTQLDWIERQAPDALARATCLLPYPQYWGWWLTDVRASEVSSLGCHTLLWRPTQNAFSALARTRGWDRKFAPLRRAWDVLGTVKPALAQSLGLPSDVLVHCGVHDSNACLARYLRSWPRLTLVSTGTWVVVMAPGIPARNLDPRRDMLGNVSVRGETVPTARFMGGREFEYLCAGASPLDADLGTVSGLLDAEAYALPCFEAQGGPFAGAEGSILLRGEVVSREKYVETFTPRERATLASLYCADMIGWIYKELDAIGPVVLEGPFTQNPVIVEALGAILPPGSLHVSVDEVEGTARGGWALTRWTEPRISDPRVMEVAASARAGKLRARHARWCQRAAACGTTVSPDLA